MADNVAITAGVGTTIATDEVGGFHYQRAKMVWGADGVATDVSVADPLPVTQITPAGDTMVDDTNDALRVTVVTGVQNAGVVASTGLTIVKTGGQITSATTTTLKTGVALQTIQIIALVLKNGALANNLTFQDSTGPTNLVGTSAVFNLAASEGLVLDPKSTGWFNPTGAGEDLQLVTSSAGPLTWYLEYTIG